MCENTTSMKNKTYIFTPGGLVLASIVTGVEYELG